MSRLSSNFSALVLMIALAGHSSTFVGARLQETQRPGDDPVRLSASLVQVPAIITDRSGKFVSDLSRDDFTIFEDGKRQEVSLFAALKQPFNAVLVLDTSNSAEDRLKAIQSAAVDFTKQLRPGDRMLAVSFDNEVKQLTDFTEDRQELESAINGTESGFGKLLYEAVARALELLKNVEGRRAVILFTDGVDMRSIEASAEGTTRVAEEVGAVIYVVRFDTRWWIEADARRREAERPKNKLPFDIDGRIPLPPDFGGPDPGPTGIPKPGTPRIEIGQRPRPPVYEPEGTGTRAQRVPVAELPDQITSTLDKLYAEADSYLKTIASRTAGRVYSADTFADTRSAFTAIADELRNQYLLGYYAPSSKHDGKYHKIKLEVSRKGLQVRSRPGYQAQTDSK